MRIFHTFKFPFVTVFADRHGSHSHGESPGAGLGAISPISLDSGVETQALTVAKIVPERGVCGISRWVRTTSEWGQPMTVEQRLDAGRWAL